MLHPRRYLVEFNTHKINYKNVFNNYDNLSQFGNQDFLNYRNDLVLYNSTPHPLSSPHPLFSYIAQY